MIGVEVIAVDGTFKAAFPWRIRKGGRERERGRRRGREGGREREREREREKRKTRNYSCKRQRLLVLCWNKVTDA